MALRLISTVLQHGGGGTIYVQGGPFVIADKNGPGGPFIADRNGPGGPFHPKWSGGTAKRVTHVKFLVDCSLQNLLLWRWVSENIIQSG